MTLSITACHTPEVDLVIGMSLLKIGKTETMEVYGKRMCKELFPKDDAAYEKILALVNKALPLLTECKQQTELSLRRVFAIMLYAKLQQAHPLYRKKDALIKKSLIIDQDALYILNVGRVSESDRRRLTKAIRVPFSEKEKATILYRLVNRAASTLSLCELIKRQKLSQNICTPSLQGFAPKVLSVYSYVSKDKKRCAFIEANKFLCLFNPEDDRHKKWTVSLDELRLYVEKGDADSVEYLLGRFTPDKFSDSNFDLIIHLAKDLNHYAVMLQLLEKYTPKQRLSLIDLIPENIDTELEKAVTRVIIDKYPDKNELFANICSKFTTLERVQFLLSLPDIPQGYLVKALSFVEDREACKLLASKIGDIKKEGGKALEDASYRGQWKALYSILELGVDVNSNVDGDGLTALFYAACKEESEESLEVIKKLLDLGADPTIVYDDFPVIYWAAFHGNHQVVALLLDRSQNREEDQALIKLAMKNVLNM